MLQSVFCGKMNFENLQTVSEEAGRIYNAADKAGLTFRKYLALVELYSGELFNSELRKRLELSGSQLSRDIISPLRDKGYIAPRKINSTRTGESISITDKGKDLIDKIGEELGY